MIRTGETTVIPPSGCGTEAATNALPANSAVAFPTLGRSQCARRTRPPRPGRASPFHALGHSAGPRDVHARPSMLDVPMRSHDRPPSTPSRPSAIAETGLGLAIADRRERQAGTPPGRAHRRGRSALDVAYSRSMPDIPELLAAIDRRLADLAAEITLLEAARAALGGPRSIGRSPAGATDALTARSRRRPRRPRRTPSPTPTEPAASGTTPEPVISSDDVGSSTTPKPRSTGSVGGSVRA